MKNFRSFLVSFFIIVVIIIILVLTFDLAGIITLPENLSMKKFLSGTIKINGDAEVYYPDYAATGVRNLIVNTTNNSSIVNPADDPTITEYQDTRIDLSTLLEDPSKPNDAVQAAPPSTVVDEPIYISMVDNITDNSYYYNQLDMFGKTIYSRLYSNLDNLKTGTYTVDFGLTFNALLHESDGEKVLTDSFQLSINALLLDHPEIFYLDVTRMYMFTETTTSITGTTYKISIGPDYEENYLALGLQSKDDVLVAETRIQNVINSLIQTLSGDDINKVKQVHDYLIDTIEYDVNDIGEVSHTVYGALIQRTAVCDGYAKAFKMILDQLGISCVEVCGIAQNSNGTTESHAWNDVLLNGAWYAVDVTWDDPILVGGNGILTDDLKYYYYLRGSEIFYDSHQEDGYVVKNGEFMYPIIAERSLRR